MKRDITISTKVSQSEIVAIEQDYDSNYLYKSDYYRERLLGFSSIVKDINLLKTERDNFRGLYKNQKTYIRKLHWTIFALSALAGSLLAFAF